MQLILLIVFIASDESYLLWGKTKKN